MTAARRGAYLLSVMTAAYAVNYLDRQILGILIEPIKRDLGLSDTQLGFLSGTAFALCYIIFGIVLGAMADVRSRRNILSGCLLVWSGATALCGLAHSFGQLFLARIVVGIGEAGCVPAAQSLIADQFAPERRASALGVFMTGGSLGTILGFVIGGWINAAFNWRVAFYFVGLPGIVLAVIVRATIREPRRLVAVDGNSSLLHVIRINVGFLRACRSFRWVAFSAGLAAMISYGLGTWLASFLIRYYHLGTAEVGLLLALAFGVSGATGILLGGHLGDRFSRKDPSGYVKFAAGALCIATPCFWIVFLAHDLTVTIVALVPAVIASQSIAAPAFAAIHGVLPTQTRGFGVAIYMFIGNLIGIGLGALAIGILSDVFQYKFGTNSLRYALLGVVSVGLPAAAGFILSAKTLRQDWQR